MSTIHFMVSGVLMYTSTLPAKIISQVTGHMDIDNQNRGNPNLIPGGSYHIESFDISVNGLIGTTQSWHFYGTGNHDCKIEAESGGYEDLYYHGPSYWFRLDTGTGEDRPVWYGMDGIGAMVWYKNNDDPINDIRTSQDYHEMGTLPPKIVMKNFHLGSDFSVPADWPTPVTGNGSRTAYLDMTITSYVRRKPPRPPKGLSVMNLK